MSYWKVYRNSRARVAEHLCNIAESRRNCSMQSTESSLEFDNEELNIKQTEQTESSSSINSGCMQGVLSDSTGSNQLSNTCASDDFESECSKKDQFSDSDCDSSDTDTDSICSDLSKWSLKFNVTNVALSSLLSILQPYLPQLPKDARTLLGTTRNCSVKTLGGGKYYHFGLRKNLIDILEKELSSNFGDEIKVQFGIDGLPLFKSSSGQFWPIVGMIVNGSVKLPFLVGLYYGSKKPDSAASFLADFAEELSSVQRNGITFNGKCYKVTVIAFICDEPARAYIKNVKSHSGYYGCDKCCQRGEWNDKVTFPETQFQLRTNISFNEMSNEEHHLGPSPLARCNIGMVSQFPIDYMHLVCLGVVRRLLMLWMKGPLTTRIGGQKISAISSALITLKDYIPKEFARKPRPLTEVDRWKATEFRQFLLYSGPVALYDKLHEPVYQNFLLLHVGISILVNPLLCTELCDYANELLVMFVQHFIELYGRSMAVYNVHGLVHLAADVKQFGCLDNFSAFPFENFLQCLKRIIRKKHLPLEQAVSRVSEFDMHHMIMGHKEPKFHNFRFSKEHNDGPIPNLCVFRQYQQMQHTGLLLSVNSANNCIKINGSIVLLRNILFDEATEEVYLVVLPFKCVKNFYNYPLESSKIGIFQVSDLSSHFSVEALKLFEKKYVALPMGIGSFVTFPLYKE